MLALPKQTTRDVMFISVADTTHRSLIELVAAQLGLTSQPVSVVEARHLAASNSATMIIADEELASELFQLPVFSLVADERPPALVAVLPAGSLAMPLIHRQENRPPYDGVLVLPQTPAVLLAQLSVILYAHEAYIQRFESATEELRMNRRIFLSVTSGISVASATEDDFPLVYVNPAFEEMTGYSLGEIVGKNCRFLQRDDRNQPGLDMVRDALKGRHKTVAMLRNYRKNGSEFWNELSLSQITDRTGRVTHFVGIQNDVTARVGFEEALRDSEKLAAVGRLAASIAHEINNPLATIMNLVYMARREETENERNELLDLAGEELNRVSLLTTQSLRFYRQSTKPTKVQPAELVASVLDVYTVKMRNHQVKLGRKLSTCQPLVCLESEIRQVISNLIRNSMDALEENPGSITVRVRESSACRNFGKGVLVTVADTGCGMSAQAKAHLYTAFHTTKGQKGTGLGLWLSKEIVDRHHGSLLVRSRQDIPSGTVFQLFLPYEL